MNKSANEGNNKKMNLNLKVSCVAKNQKYTYFCCPNNVEKFYGY